MTCRVVNILIGVSMILLFLDIYYTRRWLRLTKQHLSELRAFLAQFEQPNKEV